MSVLSESLIKEFVKATNDSSNEKKVNNSFYGEVVINNEGTFVKIDGTDILTPVEVETDVRNGDRVNINIIDHSATISSNVTMPSSGRGASDLLNTVISPTGEEAIVGELSSSIISATIYFGLSNFETRCDVPDDEWTTTVPERVEGKYLWQKTVYIRANKQTETEYVYIQGKDGTSIKISSKKIEYQVSESGTEEPTGEWSTDIPEVQPGLYLWTKITVSYTDGSDVESFSVARNGEDGGQGEPGTPGEPGTGIVNSIWYYILKGASDPAPSKPSDNVDPTTLGWTLTEPDYVEGSTDILYTTCRTIFSDGKSTCSNVSKSSSYEASKTAYDKAIFAGQKADEAAKTATNFIRMQDGIIIGDTTKPEMAENVMIDYDSVKIRNGQQILAKFGHDVELRSDDIKTFYTKDNSTVTDAAGMLWDNRIEAPLAFVEGSRTPSTAGCIRPVRPTYTPDESGSMVEEYILYPNTLYAWDISCGRYEWFDKGQYVLFKPNDMVYARNLYFDIYEYTTTGRDSQFRYRLRCNNDPAVTDNFLNIARSMDTHYSTEELPIETAFGTNVKKDLFLKGNVFIQASDSVNDFITKPFVVGDLEDATIEITPSSIEGKTNKYKDNRMNAININGTKMNYRYIYPEENQDSEVSPSRIGYYDGGAINKTWDEMYVRKTFTDTIDSLYNSDGVHMGALTLSGQIRLNGGGIVPLTNTKYSIGESTHGFTNVYLGHTSGSNALRYTDGSTATWLVGMDSSNRFLSGNLNDFHVIRTPMGTTSSPKEGFRIVGTTAGITGAISSDDIWLYGRGDATSNYIGSHLVYARTYGSAANVVVTANGVLGRSTSSSKRYKHDIKDLPLDNVKSLYNVPVRTFKYNEGYIAKDDPRYMKDIPGFIAEEIAEAFPDGVDYLDAEPEMWNSQIMIPAMMKLIQDLNNRVKELEKEVSDERLKSK